MNAPPRPLMIYDGECRFCREWIGVWRRQTRGRVDYAPSSEAAGRFPEIPLQRFAETVALVEPDGRVTYGAEAVCRSLVHAPGQGFWLWMYRRVPGFAPSSEAVYRWVARNRSRLFMPRTR